MRLLDDTFMSTAFNNTESSKDKIVANDCDLSVNKYKNPEYQPV